MLKGWQGNAKHHTTTWLVLQGGKGKIWPKASGEKNDWREENGKCKLRSGGLDGCSSYPHETKSSRERKRINKKTQMQIQIKMSGSIYAPQSDWLRMHMKQDGHEDSSGHEDEQTEENPASCSQTLHLPQKAATPRWELSHTAVS